MRSECRQKFGYSPTDLRCFFVMFGQAIQPPAMLNLFTSRSFPCQIVSWKPASNSCQVGFTRKYLFYIRNRRSRGFFPNEHNLDAPIKYYNVKTNGKTVGKPCYTSLSILKHKFPNLPFRIAHSMNALSTHGHKLLSS